MRKLIAKAWMSLDGVFDADLMNEWYAPYDSEERQNQIKETVNGSDAMIYGRTTYEMLNPYWSKLNKNEYGVADQLNRVPKYVISSSLKKADWNNSTVINKNVVDAIGLLKKQPGKQILLDGSATLVQSLLKTNLIDEFVFLVHPVVMGKGLRFFKDNSPFKKLKLIKIEPLDLGVIAQYFEVL